MITWLQWSQNEKLDYSTQSATLVVGVKNGKQNEKEPRSRKRYILKRKVVANFLDVRATKSMENMKRRKTNRKL